MPEFQNRTLICSVLFIDIVEYSRKPVVEQSFLKDRFNGLLSDALRGVAINDRIILDTGDGAAISFIGDPEDALFVATALRDEIARLAQEGAEPQLAARMGINLGPVRLVKDINGQPNIIGDGINVAQRVMTFAEPGQVLVSRSYYEVVSRLSEEASRLFSYEGARTDKHIREHEVYAVGAFPGVRKRFEETITRDLHANREAPSAATLARASTTLKGVFNRPRLATAFAVAAILALAFGARAFREADEGPSPVLAVPAQQPPAPAKTAAAPLPPIKGLPPEPQKVAETAPPVPEPKGAPADESRHVEKPVPRAEIVVREVPPWQPAREPATVAIAAPALVTLAIAPWGEVYIDGKMLGVSPPLQELELAPGRHRVELRNSASETHTITINARPGERLRIKHKFN